jgi:hypothetical protein
VKPQPKEDAAQAVLTQRPGPRATFLQITVSSTPRGISIVGELSLHEPSGRRQRGPAVKDTYAQSHVLSYTELLAVAAWWAEARCEMLPERPPISVGLPVPPGAVAAEQPGSLPGEGKGRGARTRKG